jgi:hypothetical protein
MEHGGRRLPRKRRRPLTKIHNVTSRKINNFFLPIPRSQEVPPVYVFLNRHYSYVIFLMCPTYPPFDPLWFVCRNTWRACVQITKLHALSHHFRPHTRNYLLHITQCNSPNVSTQNAPFTLTPRVTKCVCANGCINSCHVTGQEQGDHRNGQQDHQTCDP